MFLIQNLLCVILSSTILCALKMNLDRTDWIGINYQHNCLHILASREKATNPYQIISYCLSESPTEWKIEENHCDPKFTFAQLHQQHVTSEQLYRWSAPIDLIERYQLYLDQSSLMSSQLFYNCTWPRFGPLCQYSLEINATDRSSLNEIIYEFYNQEYAPTTLTCYEHLGCDHGSTSICLD